MKMLRALEMANRKEKLKIKQEQLMNKVMANVRTPAPWRMELFP